MNIVYFKNGDTLEMKKTHPCGGKLMKVISCGSDIKLRCEKCEHEFVVQRIKIEKNIKKVIPCDNANNEIKDA